MKETIARRLRSALHDSGMSQMELAAQVGVSKAAVTNWLASGQITVENLGKVAQATGVSVSYLMGLLAPKGVPVMGSLDRVREQPIDFIAVPASDPLAYLLQVSGTDLDPRYREGEYLMMYPSEPPQPGDDALLRLHDANRMEVVCLSSTGPDGVYVQGVLGGPRRWVSRERIDILHTIAGAFRGHSHIPREDRDPPD